MANKEQVERLLNDLDDWNKWRKENPHIEIDLQEANLSEANLIEADLSYADLSGSNISETNLLGASLRRANLAKANLAGSDIEVASLTDANLVRAILEGANLEGANLEGANLSGVNLRKADLGKAVIGGTILLDIDLSEVKWLGKVEHTGPSPISISTFELSRGKIAKKFLQGCGLSDWEIESSKLYQSGLSKQEVTDILYCIYDLREGKAIQINPLFISYSHKDRMFVDEVEKRLNEKGIRFWRDIHDATAGRLEKVVDRAIRQNPTVLLVLSENSVKSDWVEHEARTARELEKELGRDVLCPVALDDAWKNCAWPARLREQIMEYNILDFSEWRDDGGFGRMFRRLVEGLDLYYKEKSIGVTDQMKSLENNTQEKSSTIIDQGYWFDGWKA